MSERLDTPSGSFRRCAFCGVNEAEPVSKHCADCQRLGDQALDELYGGAGEFDKALERHLGRKK